MFHRGHNHAHTTALLVWFCATAAVIISCSPPQYAGSSKRVFTARKAKPAGENIAGLPVARDATAFPGGENVAITLSSETPIQSAASEAEAWVVTDSRVTRIKLDEAAGWPKTTWNIVDANGNTSSSSGHRTYVSEIGLLIGRTNHSGNNGGVWLASDKTPDKAVPIFRPTDQASGSRLSVTSFKIGTQAYIGFAYGSASGNKKFVRIPINKDLPTGIDVARKEEVSFGPVSQAFGGFSAVGGHAAYGSFMDQKNKSLFLGAAGGGVWGVNVERMTELTTAQVPNLSVEGRKVCNYTLSTRGNIAYALSGDIFGNITTAGGTYTFAHDPVKNIVMGGQGGSLVVAKHECFIPGGSNCGLDTGHCAVFQPRDVGDVGPMSAVGDGRVVGIARGNTSQVFLFSVNDPTNLSQGVTVKKVADIPGDAYMYNDFTGLTLYAPEQVRIIDFKKLKNFQAGKPIRYIAAGWSAASKNNEDLRGLKLELVCYKDGSAKGDYVDHSSKLMNSSSLFVLDPNICSGDIDMLEVKVSSDGTTNNFTRLSLFELRGAQ